MIWASPNDWVRGNIQWGPQPAYELPITMRFWINILGTNPMTTLDSEIDGFAGAVTETVQPGQSTLSQCQVRIPGDWIAGTPIKWNVLYDVLDWAGNIMDTGQTGWIEGEIQIAFPALGYVNITNVYVDVIPA